MKTAQSYSFLRMRMRGILLAEFLLTTLCGFTATYYVAPGGNDGAAGTSWATALKTITNGVAKTGVGDEVLLSNGVHILTAEVYIDKVITVRGWTGNRDDVIVDGNYPATINRCFSLSAGAVVADLTIRNGFADGSVPNPDLGGGVYMTVGTFRNCVISGNRANSEGAGVYMKNGAAILTNCFIVGNSNVVFAGGDGGGGVHNWNGKVYNCVISNNFAHDFGGGIYTHEITSVLKDSLIIDNVCANRGGGVLGSYGVVTNCVIQNNSAGSGGGIFSRLGTVAHCRIIGNTASAGGGVNMWQANHPLIHNCHIISNVASVRGGGVSWSSSYGELRNCLIAGNRATSAGGVYIDGLSGRLVNCTIVDNLATNTTGGVYCKVYGDLVNCAIYTNMVLAGTNYNVYNTGVSFTYSNCVTFPTAGLLGSGNVQADPTFVNSPAGNYRLRTRSPCIDAGQNQTWMDTALDLDGNPRRRDGSDVDIGCYEYEPPPPGTIFFGL